MIIQSIPQLKALRDGLIPQITEATQRLRQWEETDIKEDSPGSAFETKKENMQRLTAKIKMLLEMKEAASNEIKAQSHD